MKINFDGRWFGDHGIGRFAKEVYARIPDADISELRSLSPSDPLDCFYITWKVLTNKSIWISPGYNAPIFGLRRYIFTLHDLNHLDCEYNSNIIKRFYYWFIVRRACLYSARVLTVSEFSRQRILDWSGAEPEQVVNVGNGVSENFRPDGQHYTPGYPYLLCVGNRKPHKNEARLLAAFAKANIPSSIRLVLTGPSAGLSKIASDLSINDRVVFLGKVTDDQLPEIYRGALALVFPSLYEGFGLPVIEAMSSGIPVMTSNVTSLPEVSGGCALLVDPLDVNSIANGIEIVAQDNHLRKNLIARGITQAKQYSWENVAQKILNALEEAQEKLKG